MRKTIIIMSLVIAIFSTIIITASALESEPLTTGVYYEFPNDAVVIAGTKWEFVVINNYLWKISYEDYIGGVESTRAQYCYMSPEKEWYVQWTSSSAQLKFCYKDGSNYSFDETYGGINTTSNYWTVSIAYAPAHGEILAPEENGYTTYQDIVFTFDGIDAEDIWLEVNYLQFDGNDVNYIIGSEITHFSETLNSGVVYAGDCPYGIGVNKIRLYGNYELLDEVWVTYQKASDVSEAKIVGVDNGDVLVKPPNLSIVKNNYLNPVELIVNGHVYKSFTAETYTYLLRRDWSAYALVGVNTISLTDVWTDEVLDTFTFTITRGSVSSSGIYQMPEDDYTSGGQGLPDAWGDLTDNAPVKPDSETGTILDWIVYIGRTIGWVVEIGITAITEFGKDIGRALESLLSIFDPVFKFVSAIAGSIPTPIAVGLFAVFSVACVMAIIRFIKG